MHGGMVRSRYTIYATTYEVLQSLKLRTVNGPYKSRRLALIWSTQIFAGWRNFCVQDNFSKTLSNWAISHILWFFDYKRQVVSPTVVSVFNQRSIPQQTKHSNGFFQGISECVVSIFFTSLLCIWVVMSEVQHRPKDVWILKSFDISVKFVDILLTDPSSNFAFTTNKAAMSLSHWRIIQKYQDIFSFSFFP